MVDKVDFQLSSFLMKLCNLLPLNNTTYTQKLKIKNNKRKFTLTGSCPQDLTTQIIPVDNGGL